MFSARGICAGGAGHNIGYIEKLKAATPKLKFLWPEGFSFFQCPDTIHGWRNVLQAEREAYAGEELLPLGVVVDAGIDAAGLRPLEPGAGGKFKLTFVFVVI